MTILARRRRLILGVALAACVAGGRSLQAADGPYRFADRVRLGVAGVEYVFDAANGRLYTSTPSFPRGVFVVNTANPGIADRFGEVPFGSIDVAPDLNELFVLSISEHRIRVVDLGTRKIVRTLTAPAGHAVFFEPSRQEGDRPELVDSPGPGGRGEAGFHERGNPETSAGRPPGAGRRTL